MKQSYMQCENKHNLSHFRKLIANYESSMKGILTSTNDEHACTRFYQTHGQDFIFTQLAMIFVVVLF